MDQKMNAWVAVSGSASQRPMILVISQNAVDDIYRGNSTLLRACTDYLRWDGFRVVVLIPSLRGLGRKPFARPPLDHASVDEIVIAGGLRIGDWLIRVNPAVWWRAATAVSAKLFRRLTRSKKPAPHFWDTRPANRGERRAIRNAVVRLRPDAILLNYFILGDALDLSELKAIPKVIFTHDIFFTRTESFRRAGLPLPHAPIPQEQEIGALAKADALIAVQDTEAGILRELLPGKEILMAPPSFPIWKRTSEPIDDSIIFVGTNNELNRTGIEWFIDAVLPVVRRSRPQAVVKVYGDIARRLDPAREGVVLPGRVDDLTPHYHAAAVCIVPLLTGSGIKVKIVEALCHGCAIVSTSVGAQGLESLAGTAFLLADSVDDFAAATIRLLSDREQRQALEAAAIDVGQRRFSADACYAPLSNYFKRVIARGL